METITAQHVHDMTDQQLVDHIKDARQNLFNLRLRLATGELEDTSSTGRAKRSLARALTIARARDLNIEIQKEPHRG